MSKLPSNKQFLDLSDYGRPLSRVIVHAIKDTSLTPIHVTIGFIISGLLAILCILNQYYWATAFFLIMKSVLDAADGELARVKNTPSYTGRYLDSIADIILNLLFLVTIWYVTNGSAWATFFAFIGIQLQGTLYNYYYVILRNKQDGDTTSRVIESGVPTAFEGEKQSHVNILYYMFTALYAIFDKTIYQLDKTAVEAHHFPKWFMTAVSSFGLGFQLLIIAIMIPLGLKEYVIPFFIGYSGFILVFIGIRKWINLNHNDMRDSLKNHK